MNVGSMRWMCTYDAYIYSEHPNKYFFIHLFFTCVLLIAMPIDAIGRHLIIMHVSTLETILRLWPHFPPSTVYKLWATDDVLLDQPYHYWFNCFHLCAKVYFTSH